MSNTCRLVGSTVVLLTLAGGLHANQIVLPGSVQVSSSLRDDAPAAAFNSVDRTWLVVWRQASASDGRLASVLGRIVREDRSFVTAPFEIFLDNFFVSPPRVAHDPILNEWMVVATGQPPIEGFFVIAARKVAANGSLVGAFAQLVSIVGDGVNPQDPDIAAASTELFSSPDLRTPFFVVVWAEPLNRTGPMNIVGRVLTDDANEPSRIGMLSAQFRIDTDASLPAARSVSAPRITELAPFIRRSTEGPIALFWNESLHSVVYEVQPEGGRSDIYLTRINLSGPERTYRITASPADHESDPVVAWNPVSQRTLVLFEQSGALQGVRGQLLGPIDAEPFQEPIGGDFAVAPRANPAVLPVPTQTVCPQAGTDIFFASSLDGENFGLGCIAGIHVVGTPAAGAALGAQTFLSRGAAGNVLLAFRRHDAAGNTVIRASILTEPPPPLNNNSPVAQAGGDLQVIEGTLFSLDGSASSDPDGDPLRFSWSRTGAGDPGDFFIDPAQRSRASAQLQAPSLGAAIEPLDLTFELALDDHRIAPSFGVTDSVTVRVLPGVDTNPPIARAGPDRTVDESEGTSIVQLDGSASSDIDGDALTFGWTLASIRPSVLNAADMPLTGSSTATPTFVIPRFAQPGGIDVEWRLTVTTPRGGSGEDTVVVHIDDTVNEPPIADAGADLTGSRAVSEGTPFQLDGSASSDPNDDAITFAWELVSGLSFNGDLRETVEISGGDTATPSITAALFEERNLEFRLTVTDARGLSAIDQVVVRILQVPMQITRIAPAEGSPGTRVTIDGANFASPATRVFFGDEDLIHQGRIESISDTRIVVVVPSGGPSRLRTFVGSAHLHGVVITDYHDVRTAPITVRTGTERVVSSQPFVVSHLEIFEAYLNQGLESYPLVQGKATVLHVRVRTAPGPQSPLPGLSPDSSGAFCTAFPAGGEPFQIIPANVPPRALAPTASVTNMNQTVNFFLEPSETFFPSYRFNVLLFHNGIEVAALRTELESSVFRETVTPRVLAVHVVPYANGSVAPTWTDAEQAAHQLRCDAAFAAYGRIYPFAPAAALENVIYHPNRFEFADLIQDDGKVHMEQFGFTENFLVRQISAINDLADILDAHNAASPGQRAQIVVAMIARELYGAGATGFAVPPRSMMADIVKFTIEQNIGPADELLEAVLGFFRDVTCVATLGLFCEDPIDILVDIVLSAIEAFQLDVTGKISFVVADDSSGDTLAQEIGHNLGFVNPFAPEHDATNISHSRFDEDAGIGFLSAPSTTGPIINPVKSEAALFHGGKRPKSVMSYAPSKTNSNSFFEPSQYRKIFDVFRTDRAAGAGGGVPAGAAGPALRISGFYSFHDETLEIGEARPALPSEALTPAVPRSPFTLAFLDGAGGRLAENGLAFNLQVPVHGHGDDGSDGETPEVFALFRAVHEIPDGTERAEIRFQGNVLWTRSALGLPPQIQLLSPAADEEIAPEAELRVRWLSIDLDGDELTHSVFYSADGGETFTPIAVSLRATELRWTTGAAAGSERAVVKVVAFDGFHASEAISGAFRLGGGRLSASIFAPASDSMPLASRPVALSGLARAPGGAAVTDDSAYQWSSSVAGPLGSGRDLLAAPLPAGAHRIRLEVAAGDETASTEVEIMVLSDADGDGVDDETESAGGLDPDDPEDLFRDEDADGLATGAEVLDFESDPMQADSDLDGLSDGEEFGQGTSPTTADTDGDGRTDSDDNCPMAPNADQTDADADGIGDACDDDVIPPGPIFLRGDCNGDGGLDIADVVCTLDWLFLGSEVPGCIAALNANGDGAVDIGDPVYSLLFAFVGGPAPVAPFPECGPGTLPSDEVMGCATPPESCR